MGCLGGEELSLSPESLLSGAVGAVVVFIFTVTSGAVVRIRQRGRELAGLARVVRPEMKRNAEALAILYQGMGQGVFDPDSYQREHHIYDAWHDTRTRLAQHMQQQDFAVLVDFYEALELLDNAIQRYNVDDAHRDTAIRRLELCYERRLDAMRVVDGYCVARWRIFKGWVPGDIE